MFVDGDYSNVDATVKADSVCCEAGKSTTDIDQGSNLVLACSSIISYECDGDNDNCMKTTSTPIPGGNGTTEDVITDATDEEICSEGIKQDDSAFKEKCPEP